ncbi:MAG: hypothetical protein Q4Q18_05760 [Methanobrevibacter sp.]|nr:hypothetical protein [Methanobrevibacter sp.]
MIGTIAVIILFILVIFACCSSGSGSGNTSAGRNVSNQRRSTNNNYGHHSFSECPSCGNPYYDGYCEECGYPDINQGWIGENY